VRSYRILHVDDDPSMRDIVELALGLDPKFALMSCASGDETLAMAPDWAPDLILCDVMMPDMDGPALLALLRANFRTAKIPIVFMTARAQPNEIAHLKSLGAGRGRTIFSLSIARHAGDCEYFRLRHEWKAA
jgi:CheY-like chemotaxis protein